MVAVYEENHSREDSRNSNEGYIPHYRSVPEPDIHLKQKQQVAMSHLPRCVVLAANASLNYRGNARENNHGSRAVKQIVKKQQKHSLPVPQRRSSGISPKIATERVSPSGKGEKTECAVEAEEINTKIKQDLSGEERYETVCKNDNNTSLPARKRKLDSEKDTKHYEEIEVNDSGICTSDYTSSFSRNAILSSPTSCCSSSSPSPSPFDIRGSSCLPGLVRPGCGADVLDSGVQTGEECCNKQIHSVGNAKQALQNKQLENHAFTPGVVLSRKEPSRTLGNTSSPVQEKDHRITPSPPEPNISAKVMMNDRNETSDSGAINISIAAQNRWFGNKPQVHQDVIKLPGSTSIEAIAPQQTQNKRCSQGEQKCLYLTSRMATPVKDKTDNQERRCDALNENSVGMDQSPEKWPEIKSLASLAQPAQPQFGHSNRHLSPNPDTLKTREPSPDPDEFRTRSLPILPTSSSYANSNPKTLPPKKRRLWYEQDLESGSSSLPLDRQSPKNQAPSIRSLPNDFDPSKLIEPSSNNTSLPPQVPAQLQPMNSSFLPYIGPNNQVLYFPISNPLLGVPPLVTGSVPNLVGVQNSFPMGYFGLPPNAVQDLSRGMEALKANETVSMQNCNAAVAADAQQAAQNMLQHQQPPANVNLRGPNPSSTQSMPIIYEHSRLPNQKSDTSFSTSGMPYPSPPVTGPLDLSRDTYPEQHQRVVAPALPETIPSTVLCHSAESPSPKPNRRQRGNKGTKRKDQKQGSSVSPSPHGIPASTQVNTLINCTSNTTSPVPMETSSEGLAMTSTPEQDALIPSPALNDIKNTKDGHVTKDDPDDAKRRMAIEPDEDGDLPLHIAVVQNEASAVECIIGVMKDANVSIDYHNHLKQTPLHLAIITKLDPIVRLLLDAHASPNVPNRKGQTCVHLAVNHRTVNCLRTILEHSKVKVDLNAKNYEGLTPLHRAVQIGNRECLLLLLEHGADINMVDGKSGKSPLYLAFECNQPQVADLLLSKGADVSIPTYSGSTVLQAANTRGQHLLTHFIGRTSDGSTNTKDFQNKLTAKINRNRQKHSAGPLQTNRHNNNNNNITKDAELSNSRHIAPRLFHSNGILDSHTGNLNVSRDNHALSRMSNYRIPDCRDVQTIMAPPMES